MAINRQFLPRGAYDSALLGCQSIAILPEGMSKERFDWLSNIAGEVIKTPGSESNVKEIFDKCWELRRSGEDLVIFNQFEEFGNYLWHYEVTGHAMEEVINIVSGPDNIYRGMVSATGSAGTIASGDYMKQLFPASKIVASEALQCPTLLENGFGAHRIEGATGADTNSGAKDVPLRTLAEAARRVNQTEGTGPLTVILSEGVYAVGETATFKPERRALTKTERLTIRAEGLPDDPDWHTGRMPTLIHTLPLTGPQARGLVFGMLTEANHVTIQGLKLLGAPVVESPKAGMLVRVYPIGRMGRQLDDLEIAQCLFAGDKVVSPNHLGILAHGSGIHVHHCVLYNAKLTVVFWTGGSRGHSMHHCFVHGAYGSGVWTCEVGDDFEFRNNVIANGNYVWTYQSRASAGRDPDAGGQGSGATTAPEKQRVHYKVVDSLFAANKKMACSGTGANPGFKDIDAFTQVAE